MAERHAYSNKTLGYKVELFEDMELVLSYYRFDLCICRTPKEAVIGEKLQSLNSRVQEWYGVGDYHPDRVL